MSDELTLDRLTAEVSVFQRRDGHRFSSDDMVTAWAALQVSPQPRRVLDLGCGLGSVLLHLAWSLPDAQLDGVEVQDVSYALLCRNVTHNAHVAGIGERVAIRRGDFRDGAVSSALRAPFDLVTGTPPYFPPGTASHAVDEQRTRARIETCGGVEDYITTGASLMADDGRLVVCGDADAEQRALTAAQAVDLHLVARWVVIPRAGRPPLFSVWAMGRTTAVGAVDRTLVLRDADGARTSDARMLRAFSGFPESADVSTT